MEATMHCPNCGTEASARQKFCRACGLSLDRFAQLLAELLPDGEDENVARDRRRLRLLERAARIAGWTIGSALGIFLTFFGAYILIKRHDGGAIFPLLFGVGIIAAMFLISYGSSLKKKVSERFLSLPKLPSAETTNKLLTEHEAQIAMSVTEQTTARLDEKVGESR
jgi:zinc ribbon protein